MSFLMSFVYEFMSFVWVYLFSQTNIANKLFNLSKTLETFGTASDRLQKNWKIYELDSDIVLLLTEIHRPKEFLQNFIL